MFPLIFFSAYILDLLTTLLALLRGAAEANPVGWPAVFYNNTAALVGGLAGYFVLLRYSRRRLAARPAAALVWALIEAAGVARIGLAVTNNVLVIATGYGFADAVGFHGVMAGTIVLTAVLAPLFFLLAKIRISP